MSIKIIAHRGASGSAPENTLAAARLAHAQGADMWELDVGLTADRIPMLLHDESLFRTTNAAVCPAFVHRHPWLLERFTLAETQTLDAGVWFGPAYKGEPLPSLEDALKLSAELNFPVNVEIKAYFGLPAQTLALTEAVLALIAHLDLAELVLISSFSLDCLRLVCRQASHLPLAVLAERGDEADLHAACLEVRATAAHPGSHLVSADGLARLREAGLEVNVWTVNNAEKGRELAGLGASGLITDYPARLRAEL